MNDALRGAGTVTLTIDGAAYVAFMMDRRVSVDYQGRELIDVTFRLADALPSKPTTVGDIVRSEARDIRDVAANVDVLAAVTESITELERRASTDCSCGCSLAYSDAVDLLRRAISAAR